MYQNGHYGAALLVYAPLGFLVAAAGFRGLALAGGGLALALAMVPDWDTRVPGIEHRGVTHTVWFALLVGIALGAAGWVVGTLRGGSLASVLLGGFGFAVGTLTICSHVAADALTPAGVTPFAPLDTRHVSYEVTRASNTLANWLLLALGVVAAGGAYGLALAVSP